MIERVKNSSGAEGAGLLRQGTLGKSKPEPVEEEPEPPKNSFARPA